MRDPSHLSTLSAHEAAESAEPVDQKRLTRFLGFRLTRTELRIHRQFVDCVKAFDLKPVDFSLLVLVDANAGINQRQLSEVLDVSPPNLAIVVARLVKRGLLRQLRGTQDRRMQHLHLTAPGKTLLGKAEIDVIRMEDQLALGLSANEAKVLQRALDKLDRA